MLNMLNINLPFATVMKASLAIVACGSVVACASGPDKVRQAEQERAETVTDYDKKQVALSTDQTKQTTDVERKQDSQVAELQKDMQTDVAKADADVVAAKQDMAKQRASFEIDARGRIDKVDVNVRSIRERLVAKKPAERSSVEQQLQTIDQRRGELLKELSTASNLNDEAWNKAKDEIKRKIELLDQDTNKLLAKA